jgi:hypothetical protein
MTSCRHLIFIPVAGYYCVPPAPLGADVLCHNVPLPAAATICRAGFPTSGTATRITFMLRAVWFTMPRIGYLCP